MRPALVERLIAAVFCALACGASAAELGTLFHSPGERERLDRLRRGEPVAEAPSAETPARKEITGYVKRSDGRSTAFIDGEPVPVDPRGTRLLDPKSVRAYAGRPSEDLKIERVPERKAP